VVDPKPPAIHQVSLERFAGHTPAPGQGSDDEGLDIIVVNPHSKTVPVCMAKNLGEGEWAIIVPEEHALVGLVGIPQVVLGIKERHCLPAFRQGLHKASECLIVD
jgi:hypothetical protein